MNYGLETVLKYFPDIDKEQRKQFDQLADLYAYWNARINVISRKDIEALYVRHVLHSLGIAKVIQFVPNTMVLDVGTGGGFPGIPLAILFPDCQFHLVDSIKKKLKVIDAISAALRLSNVHTTHSRAEELKKTYDFVVSRAVTGMPVFVGWVKDKIKNESRNTLKNGILYLKGGDLTEELQPFPKAAIHDLSDYFKEPFFDTKKVVHLPL